MLLNVKCNIFVTATFNIGDFFVTLGELYIGIYKVGSWRRYCV